MPFASYQTFPLPFLLLQPLAPSTICLITSVGAFPPTPGSILCLFPGGPHRACPGVLPQPPVPFAELSGVRRFSTRALNYSTLLLEDNRGILYVGARGAIFALNSSNVADGSHRTVSQASACRWLVVLSCPVLPRPCPNCGHPISAHPPARHLRSCLVVLSPGLSPRPLWVPGPSPQAAWGQQWEVSPSLELLAG